MIFAFLICMTASFAATDQDMQLNTTDNDVISIDENLNEQSSQENNEQNYNLAAVDDGSDDLLKDTGTFQEIRDKINSASGGGTVDLENREYSRSGYTSAISIDKQLTIDGHGAVIDGGGSGTIFSVTATSILIFKNMTIQRAGVHAIMFNVKATQVTFDNVNFTNNKAAGSSYNAHGGAIYYNDNAENIRYINCNFIANSANGNGGAIYIGAQSTGNEYVNTTFRDNKVEISMSGGGGAIHVNGASANDKYDNVTFEGNKVIGTYVTNTQNPYTFAGGALYLKSKAEDISFKSTDFISNTVGSKGTLNQYYHGGAIYYGSQVNNNMRINYTDCNFTNNEAKSRGGAIYIKSNSLNNSYTNTAFNQNKAGGAVKNSAMSYYASMYEGGGAIFLEGTSSYDKFINVEFNKNEVNSQLIRSENYNLIGGGAVYYSMNADNLTFYNVNFTENGVGGRYDNRYYGGALYFASVMNADYTNCNFTGNYAKRSGGAIYISNSHASNYLNVIFEDNYAQSSYNGVSYGGGAIFIIGQSDSDNFDNATFRNNKVIASSATSANSHYNGGGAIFFNANVLNLNINNSIFEGNSLNKINYLYGGAINFAEQFTNVTVENSHFKNNSAYTGGAIYFNGYNSQDTLIIKNNTFEENNASNYAGALYLGQNVKNISFTKSNFVKNSASHGGAIYFNINRQATFDDVNFTQNSASGSGAAIHLQDTTGNVNANFTFTNMNFKNNRGNSIIRIYYVGCISTFENVTFTGNDGGSRGIISYDEGSSASIVKTSFNNVDFINNTKNYGAISVSSKFAEMSLENMKFINNTANSIGGAVYTNQGSRNSYKNITFQGNKALSGGAIYASGESHDTFEDVEFIGNEASNMGGAVFYTNANDMEFEATFKENRANYGAALYIQSQTQNAIINSRFVNNTSPWGAIVYVNQVVFIENSNFTQNDGDYVIQLDGVNTSGSQIYGSKFDKNTRKVIYAKSNSNTNFIDEWGYENIKDYDVEILNSVFDENGGNAVYLENLHAIIENTEFTNNRDVALYAINSYSNNLYEVNFTRNNGGAVFINSTANIGYSNFKDNYNTAVAVSDESQVEIYNSKFINNTAAEKGGAIRIIGSECQIRESEFMNNTANSGGAIYLTSQSSVNLEGVTFTNNTAMLTGGSIFISSSAKVDVFNSQFTYNKAMKGSAIDNRGTLSISDSQLFKNKALSALNAFYNRLTGKVEITYTIGDNYIHAIHSANNVKFSNVEYFEYADNTYNTDDYPPVKSEYTSKKDITVTFNNSNGELLESIIVNTEDNGKAILDPIQGFETVTASTEDDDYYYHALSTCNSSLKGDFDILQELIINDTTGTVTLDRDYTYTVGVDTITEGIIINKPIVIDGAGHKIDALYYSRIFNVISDNVVFKNIEFVNATALDGSFIYLDNVKDIIIDNCTFSNPGCLPVPTSTGIGVVHSTNVFEWIDANHGGFLSVIDGNYYDFDGGAIYALSDGLDIINSNFSNTAATAGGALYYNGSNLNIKNSNWKNIIGVYGGAIYVVGSNVTIDDCEFNRTLAACSGGAVLAYGEDYNITNSHFTYTLAYGVAKAETDSSGEFDPGVPIIIGSSVGRGSLLGGDFIENPELTPGGEGESTVNYLSEFGGGAIHINADNVNIINDTFTTAASLSVGGAIFAEGNNHLIYNSTFINCFVIDEDIPEEFIDQLNQNSLDKPYGGGAIFSRAYDITIDESSFEICKSTTIGGAIFADGEKTSITNSNFTHAAAIAGGAVYIGSNAIDSIIDGCEFEDNLAASHGGALVWTAPYGTLRDSTFNNNQIMLDEENLQSMLAGAGMVWSADHGMIYNCNFTNNKAAFTEEQIRKYSISSDALIGGAGVIIGGNITVSECLFDSNHAVNGGALYIYGHAVIDDSSSSPGMVIGGGRNIGGGLMPLVPVTIGVTIEKSNFTNNIAKYGGAVLTDGEDITFDGCEFENNTALEAGAIYLQSNMTTVSNSTFKDNAALVGGAIVGGISKVEEYWVDDRDGGHWDYYIVLKGIQNTISNSTFINNEAESAGAILWIGNNGVITDNSHFISNKHANVFDTIATALNKAFDFTINETEYENYLSEALTIGTMIESYYEDQYSYSFENVTLNRDAGGAVYWFGHGGSVEYSTFTQNRANKGGAVYWENDDGWIVYSNFTDNEAYAIDHVDVVKNTTYIIYYYNYTDENIHDWKYNYANSIDNPTARYFLVNDRVNSLREELSSQYGLDVEYVYGKIENYTEKGTYIYDVTVKYVFKMSKNQTIEYTVPGQGGAIYSNTNSLGVNGYFEGNTADYGGAVYGVYGEIVNSHFTNNSAVKGGAVYARNQSGPIFESTFENNYGISKEMSFATVAREDHVIHIENPETSYNGIIYTNVLKYNEAFKYFEFIEPLMNQSIIGFIVIDESRSQLVPEGYEPQDTQDETGEGDYGRQIPSDYYGVIEYGDGEGGDSYFIATLHYIVSIIKYDFSTADGLSYGGAVYIEGDNTDNINTIEASNFTNNTADYGGAVYVGGEMNSIASSQFANNTAKYGGAIYNHGNMTSIEGNFYNNTARYGGAIYSDEIIGIFNSEFMFNKAYRGSAIYSNATLIYVESSALLENQAHATSIITSATVDGNDIYVTVTFEGNDNLMNAMFVENGFELHDVYYWAHEGIVNSNDENPGLTSLEDGINITLALLNVHFPSDITYINMTNIQGQTTFYVPSVRSGRYYVIASHEEDNYYTRMGSFEVVQVGTEPTFIDIQVEDIFYRQNETVNITLANVMEGNVTVYVNGEFYSVEKLTNGFASLNLSNLKVGSYNITVQYNGSDKNDPSNESAVFNVKQINSTVTIETDGGDYSSDIPVNVTVGPYDDVTGKIIITIEDEFGLTLTIKSTNELKTFVNHLRAGSYNITAYYTGDVNYLPSSNQTILVVNPIDLNPVVSATNVTTAEKTVFTLVVPDDFVGKVNITVDGITKTYDIAGSTQVTFVNLEAGNKASNVTFYGDKDYNNATVYPVNFTVTEVKTYVPTMTVEIPDTTYPLNTTAQVNVSDNMNGTAIIMVDGTPFTVTITNGTGKVNITGLSAGIKTALVNFTSTDKKTNLTATTRFAINKAQSAISVRTDGNDVIVNVTEGATGEVAFYVNGVKQLIQLTDSQAKWEGILTIGNNTIVVVYEGDVNYTESENNTHAVIDKLESLVNVTAENPVYGSDAVITVKVPTGQTGYVTITLNNTNYTQELENGQAEFHIPGLAVKDNYEVNVTYQGNDRYAAQTNSTMFNVTKADLNAVVYGFNVTVNDNISFIITNLPSDFQGKVNITVDDDTYTGEPNSLIVMGKHAEGMKTANVVFWGDSNYKDLPLTVNFTVTRPAPTTTTMNITVDDVTYKTNAIANITVSGRANGTLTLMVDGKALPAVNVINGTVLVDLGVLSAGVRDVSGIFNSTDAVNTNTTASTKFTVKKASSTVNITVNGRNVTATVTPGATGEVTFYVNGEKQVIELENSQATWNDILSEGNNTIIVVYEGDANYTESENNTENNVDKLESFVNVTAENIVYGNDTHITVRAPVAQTGYVTITVNNNNYTQELKGGEAVFTIPGLDAMNDYIVNVTYLGNDKYSSRTNTTRFNVTKADLNATVMAENITVLQNGTFIISHVPSDFTGKVNITVDGETYTRDVDSIVSIPQLTAGNKTATVVFWGDANYNDLTLTAGFAVSRIPTTVTVEIADVTYPGAARAIVTVSGNATGNVVITIDGVDYPVSISNGRGETDLAGLSGGVKDATVVFTVSDGVNSNATGTAKFTVNKAKSQVNITVDGKNVIATVTTGTTGEVTFYVNGVKQAFDLAGSMATWENILKEGNNTIMVVYEGDVNYTESQNNTAFEVPKRESFVNVTAEPIVYGNDTHITVKVPMAQTGYVTITVNNENYTKELKDGEATFTVSGLSVNEYVVNVTYLGDETYGISTNSTRFNVTKADLNASVMGENITVLQNATFIISHIPGDFTGKVNITVDGETHVRDADSLVNTPQLTAGNKTATVVFWGDANYNDLTLTVDFAVSRIPTAVSVEIADVTYPNAAKAIVTVSGNATGNMVITIDGVDYHVAISNGNGETDLTGLSGGVKDATAVFTVSDDVNSNATGTAKFTVNKAKSQVNITVDGKNVIATVTDGATGNVTFYVNGQKQVLDLTGSNVAWENILKEGNNTIVIVYGGDANYTDSENNTELNIPKIESLVSVIASQTVYGSEAIITVNVPADQKGFVTITVDEKNYTQEIRNGKAEFSIQGLAVREYEVKAFYLGDETYDVNANSTRFNVTKADLPATAIGQNITSSDNAAFFITVPDDFTGKVNITVDGQTYSGPAQSMIAMDKLSVGSKTAEVKFYGDANYKDLNVTASFNVVDPSSLVTFMSIKSDNMTRGYNSEFDYQAAFLDAKGNALKDTEVTFKVNGKEYKAKTDKDGIAKLTDSKLAVGKYNVTSINPVTGEEATNTVEIVKRILENKDLTMDYLDGSSFRVKVIGDDGNVAPEGEIIDISANGIHYVSKVDKNGYATLKINLVPKKYTIVAEYKGFKTTNKLVVKQTLKVVKKTIKVKKGKKITIKATLKWSNGKGIKGKVIKFRFKGKTYKAKTNKKGLAKVVIKKKKVLKKLKKGKTCNVKVTYSTKLKLANGASQTINDVVKCKVKIKK